MKKPASTLLTAKEFIHQLLSFQSKEKSDNSRFFQGEDKKNKFVNVRFGTIFALAKKFSAMPLDEVNHMLDSDYYEVRMGAVSIMDFQARDKKTSPVHKKDLYNLYIKRHDRINNWDLVDRSAPFVVGGYLVDQSRAPLYKLAKSKNPWERRAAIVATYFFIRKGEIGETFKIAELLIQDKHELVNKAVGSWVREAGKRDRERLIEFLDEHAATMPRITLRYAIEKLDKKLKNYYMKPGADH